MIEIIANWHPVFVHFTVALLSLTVCFHLLGRFVPDGSLKKQFETLAGWNLWLGTGFGITSHDHSAPTGDYHDVKAPPLPEVSDHHDHDTQMHPETDEVHDATGTHAPEDVATNHDHEDHVR